MSGILGIVNRNRDPVPEDIVNAMLDAMNYWQPDARGKLLLGHVALGHAMSWNTPESKFDYAPAPPEILSRALALKDVCERYNVPLRAAALQFVFGHPAVVSVVAGARSVAHLDDAVTNLQVPIPDELWTELRREGLLPAGVPTP